MLYPILITITLFFVGLGLRAIFKDLCALCFAFASTWIILIIANLFLKITANPLILGIYMGGNAVGLMYYLSSKLPKKFFVFKLPFLVSLVFLIYSFLYFNLEQTVLLSIILLWIIFLLLFNFRNFSNFKNFINKLIECCKDW